MPVSWFMGILSHEFAMSSYDTAVFLLLVFVFFFSRWRSSFFSCFCEIKISSCASQQKSFSFDFG